MTYASIEEFKEWIISDGENFDAGDDETIESVLGAVDRWVNRYCARHFTLESGATHYYYPSEQGILKVVDLVSITSIANDSHGDRTYSQTFTATDYELLPYLDEAGLPSVRFDTVRIWPTSSKTWGPGRLVRIVGNFGYVDGTSVPADVKQASRIMAARWWKRREAPLGVLNGITLGELDTLSKSDPDVTSLLGPYTRRTSWVAV